MASTLFFSLDPAPVRHRVSEVLLESGRLRTTASSQSLSERTVAECTRKKSDTSSTDLSSSVLFACSKMTRQNRNAHAQESGITISCSLAQLAQSRQMVNG